MQKIFSTAKLAQVFVLCEVILVFLIAALVYKVLGMEIHTYGIYFFQYPLLFQNLLWLIGAVAFLGMIHYAVGARDLLVSKVYKEFWGTLFSEVKFKVNYSSRHVVLLWFVELVVAIVIALSIYVYLDPEVNVLPHLPWYVKIIAFVAIVGFALYIFSQTKLFRELCYGPSLARRTLVPKHKLFNTRRVTSSKRGTIRVASKRRYLELKHKHSHRFAKKSN